MVNKIKQSAQSWTSKCIKAVTMLGATILITLTAQAKPTNAAVQKEIAEIFKKNPDKEIIVKVENNQSTEKAAKFEMMPDDSIQDPYDQIKNYVEAENLDYFNQLQAHMETKDSTEQIRCKAVIYAILQDTLLNQEQRQILALGYFERLARMPGSDYRFRLQWKKTYEWDQAYADRRNFYSWYKDYLDVVALDEEIAKLNKKVENLRKQNELLQQLLNWYNDK